MSKKELMAKIAIQKKKEIIRHSFSWVYDNLHELSTYVEVGDNYKLRESAHHAIRHLVKWAERNVPGFNTPWFVYY